VTPRSSPPRTASKPLDAEGAGRLRRRRARPRREHRHPFLTARYRWITGDHLSLLDLIALVLAVPVHLAYAVFTVATTGSMREFGRDAAGLAAAMKPAPALGVGGTDDADPALGAGDPAAEPYPSAEITFTVLRVMYAWLAAASDLLFLPQVAAGGAPEAGIGWKRPVVKMLKAVTGVAGGVLLSTRSAWAERVNSLIGHAHPDRDDIIKSVVGRPWISFAIGAAADDRRARWRRARLATVSAESRRPVGVSGRGRAAP
jgi:hypothetical protein